MTCQHCGAALPPFALFCGECGRSVSAPAVVPPVVERPVPPVTAPLPVATPEAVPAAAPDALPWSADGPLSIDSPVSPEAPVPFVASSPEPCATCGTVPDADDLYCAECGRPLPGDTRVIEPVPAPTPSLVPVIAAAPVSEPEPVPMAVAASRPEPEQEQEPEQEPTPEPAPADVESTRIVPRGTGGARFVLQFSTGESYTVLGSGLAGRNPRPEPGEYVDHLVTILDPGRSVSKTHLEFGQQAGVFWVSDRHSGNGTVLREPGAEPRPCEPGRRYPIVRGTRIDIGEQFVVVS